MDRENLSSLNEEFVLDIKSYFKYFISELEMTNKSQNTITSYTTTINSFCEFCLQHRRKLSFAKIKKIDIMDFLEYKNLMLEKHTELKASCKKLYLVHLKSLFTYIQENMDEEIALKTVFNINIKVPKRTPKGVEKEGVEAIENYLENLELDNFFNIRASIMIKILLYSGARRGELIRLTINDFNENGILYVITTIGKGDKERTLYIPKAYIETELNYFKEKGYTYIASTKKGRQMDGSEVYRFVNNKYKSIGIKYTGVHILRHTFAKDMLANDVNIVNVQELLGHADIQTTMIYTKPQQKEIENIYSKVVGNKS